MITHFRYKRTEVTQLSYQYQYYIKIDKNLFEETNQGSHVGSIEGFELSNLTFSY